MPQTSRSSTFYNDGYRDGQTGADQCPPDLGVHGDEYNEGYSAGAAAKDSAAHPTPPYHSYLDEIDAVAVGQKWLNALARRRGADQIDSDVGEKNSIVRSAWKSRRLLACFAVLRDPFNHSVLVCSDLSAELECDSSHPASGS